jgi:hypothetical protein
MQVYSVADGMGESLVIAENLEQAKAIFLERSDLHFESEEVAEFEWDEVPPETSIEVRWEYSDLDPEHNDGPDEFKVFKLTDSRLFDPVEKTAKEWTQLLGVGLLAIDMAAYTGNLSMTLYHRRCWKRSRQLPN